MNKLRRSYLLAICVASVFHIGCTNRSDVPPPPEIDAEITDEDLGTFVQEMFAKARDNPSSALHRGRLAMTYHANNFRTEAIQAYMQASMLDESDSVWPYLSALVHIDTGHTSEALRSLEQSLERDRSYLPAKLYRGQFLLELGEFEEAENEMQSVLDFNPEEPFAVSAQTLMARIYRATDRTALAIELLEPLYEEYGHAYLARLLGRAYRDEGQTEKSRILLPDKVDPQSLQWPDARADKINPYARGFTKRLVTAEEFIQQGRISDALSILEALIELRPEDTAVINNLGIAYRLDGRISDSSGMLKRGLAIEQTDHLLLFNLGVNYEVLDQTEQALTYYRNAVTANPGLLPAYERMANLLINQDSFREAIDVLQDSLIHTEESASTRYLIGLVHGMLGSWQDSVYELHRAADLAPDDGDILVRLALSLAQIGDIEGAKTALGQAELLNPDTPLLREVQRMIEAAEIQASP